METSSWNLQLAELCKYERLILKINWWRTDSGVNQLPLIRSWAWADKHHVGIRERKWSAGSADDQLPAAHDSVLLQPEPPNASLTHCILSLPPKWPEAFTFQLIHITLKCQNPTPMCRHNSQISPDVEDFHLFHTHTKENWFWKEKEKRKKFRWSSKGNFHSEWLSTVPEVLSEPNILEYLIFICTHSCLFVKWYKVIKLLCVIFWWQHSLSTEY